MSQTMVCFAVLLIASFVASSNGYQIFGKNADSYVDNQPFENQFKYGYQVRVENDQFQHKYKSPQNVTFGCYGYTQQDVGGEHRIYYVSDQFGYRTVEVGQTVTIFPQPGKSPVQQQWQELPFPAGCFKETTGGDPIGEGNDPIPEIVPVPPTGRCVHPFGSDGKSFIKNIMCESVEKSESGVVTLFYPFHIACTEMEKFEIQLNQLVAKFNKPVLQF
ncbi:uncharacterized protein LOC118503547 [Anopheles stephensi]|uniref:uncharacterized protein LOC118503547 n=1 Tax=Anopheles stephensi TaxID=30069 RepID=UPI0016587738|nr:uncharacterized protein LOC118503547 [Anopheles stephensi]